MTLFPSLDFNYTTLCNKLRLHAVKHDGSAVNHFEEGQKFHFIQGQFYDLGYPVVQIPKSLNPRDDQINGDVLSVGEV